MQIGEVPLFKCKKIQIICIIRMYIPSLSKYLLETDMEEPFYLNESVAVTLPGLRGPPRMYASAGLIQSDTLGKSLPKRPVLV